MLKTAEALIAIVLSLIFVVLIFSKVPSGGIPKENIDVLHTLQQDDEFRNCVTAVDISCVRIIVNESISGKFQNYVEITSDPSPRPATLPETGVFIESVMITGNITNSNPKIVTLYYWK